MSETKVNAKDQWHTSFYDHKRAKESWNTWMPKSNEVSIASELPVKIMQLTEQKWQQYEIGCKEQILKDQSDYIQNHETQENYQKREKKAQGAYFKTYTVFFNL